MMLVLFFEIQSGFLFFFVGTLVMSSDSQIPICRYELNQAQGLISNDLSLRCSSFQMHPHGPW